MLIIWISCAKGSGSGIHPTHFYRFFRLFLHFISPLLDGTSWTGLRTTGLSRFASEGAAAPASPDIVVGIR